VHQLQIVYRRNEVKPQPKPQPRRPRRPSVQLSSDNLSDMQRFAVAGFNGNLSAAINWALTEWVEDGGGHLIESVEKKAQSKAVAEA
jgi:hypothetical protein